MKDVLDMTDAEKITHYTRHKENAEHQLRGLLTRQKQTRESRKKIRQLDYEIDLCTDQLHELTGR